MKRKKMSISIVLIMTALITCIFPAIASAETYQCAVCTITKVGMWPGRFGTTDGFLVKLEDAAGQWTGGRVFYLDDSLGKAGMATVLTAFSLGKTVTIMLADTAAGSLVYYILINEND